jgi:hypothetical protein
MRVAVTHSQLLSITLGHLATRNNFGNLTFIGVISPTIGIIVLETWLLFGRQTDGNSMHMAQYCPQTVQYIVQRFNATPTNSIIFCNN